MSTTSFLSTLMVSPVSVLIQNVLWLLIVIRPWTVRPSFNWIVPDLPELLDPPDVFDAFRSFGLSLGVHDTGTTFLPSQMSHTTVPVPPHVLHATWPAPPQILHAPTFTGLPSCISITWPMCPCVQADQPCPSLV